MTLDPRDRPPVLLVLAVLATLSACGGGGGGAADAPVDTGVPAAATATFTVSQAGAEALARGTVQHTRDLLLAKGLTAGVATAQGGSLQGRPLSAGPLRQAQAVTPYTDSLCSSGTATVDVADAILQRFASNPAATLQPGEGLSFAASRCVVKAAALLGDVALGSFGTGATIDGGFALTLTTRSGNDIAWTLRYTGFSYTPLGGTAFSPLDATLVFGTVGGVDSYQLDIPGTRFLKAPVVGQVGSTITVTSGSLRSALPAAVGSGWADAAYAGWVVDAVALKATAGTATVHGAGSAVATISAGVGGYAVRFNVGGVASGPFQVTP